MLLTKYIFYAILHNDLPPPTQTASTPRSYSCPFNNFHTPVFCRSATYSIETPCALFQKYRGVHPYRSQIGKAGDRSGWFVYLRRSFGVASQRSWPLGGDSRFNSMVATPAFFSCVT